MIRKTKAVKQRDLLSGFLCLRMAERYLGKSDLLCWIDSKKVFRFVSCRGIFVCTIIR